MARQKKPSAERRAALHDRGREEAGTSGRRSGVGTGMPRSQGLAAPTPEAEARALDLLMEDLPDEDDLDVDFDGFGVSGGFENDCPTSEDDDEDENDSSGGDRSPPKPAQQVEEGIYRRTRTHVPLEGYEISDLERPLRVAMAGTEGDYEDIGGGEYLSYVNFLDTLNASEGEGEDEEEGEDYAGFQGSIFSGEGQGHRRATRQAVKQVGVGFEPIELPALGEGPSPFDSVEDDEDDEVVRILEEPEEAGATGGGVEVGMTWPAHGNGEPTGFEDDQLRQLYFQIHSHTQLLLQTLEKQYDPGEHGEAGRQTCPAQEMLQDILNRERDAARLGASASQGGPAYSIWSDRGMVERMSSFVTEAHLDFLSREEPHTIWSNALVAELPTVVYNKTRSKVTVEGSLDDLCEDLGEQMNIAEWDELEALAEDFEKRKKKVLVKQRCRLRKMKGEVDEEELEYKPGLFTPKEDELMARAIERWSLRYDLIHRDYVVAKTAHQIKLRINNLMSRKKGNPVEVMVNRRRTEPLSDFEASLIREGMLRRGPKRGAFKDIHTDNPDLAREWAYLSKLWDKRCEVCETDRAFYDELKRRAEEEKRRRELQERQVREREKEVRKRLKREEKERRRRAEEEERQAQKRRKAACAPASAPRQWNQELDRIVLLSVQENGEGAQGATAAWEAMGGNAAPFSLREVSDRIDWLWKTYLEVQDNL